MLIVSSQLHLQFAVTVAGLVWW